MIIGIVGAKGGTGKTTLSVHSAAWFHVYDYATVLVDCDLQQLSSKWMSEALPKLPTLRATDPHQIVRLLPELHRDYQVVIVDGPGDLSETTGAILSVADAVLLPTGPGSLEIDGLNWTIQTVQQIREAREGVPAAVIVPMRATKGLKTTNHLYKIAPRLGFGITPTTLPYRNIYQQSAGVGDQKPQLLWTMGRNQKVRQAALEMDQLMQGIFPEACEEDTHRIRRLVTPPKLLGDLDMVRTNDGKRRKVA